MYWFKVKNFVRFYLIAFFASFFFLCLTFLTFWEVHERVDERNQNLFEFRAQNTKAAIEKRMQDYIQILKGVKGFYEASDSVSLYEWRKYVESLSVDENFPGIQGIGFSAILKKEEIKSFENKVQKEAHPDFKVWPEGERPFYTSILFLEPLNFRNTRALGYDMFSDTVRRAAMEMAIQTGKPALSGMVKLVQETNVGIQNGFLLYLPVYRKQKGNPNEEPVGKASLAGFAYSPFRVNDLMKGVLGGQLKGLDIEIYDGSEINESYLLYDHNSDHRLNSTVDLSQASSLNIGGHEWMMLVAAGPGFGYETSFPWYILAGGIIISFLIFMIMYSVANFRKSNYLNQLITDNATPALFILDNKGYCTFVNPAAEVLTGYSFGEINDRLLHNLFHKRHPDGSPYPIEDCPISQAHRNKSPLFKHEDFFIKKNGEFISVSINSQPIHESGRVVAHLMEVRDISQEKNAEIAVKERNRNLEMLNNIGKNLSAELDLKKLLQLVTDSCTELIQAELGAFFYSHQNDIGEEVKFYTLSLSRNGAFSHISLQEENILFNPGFEDKLILRVNDVLQEPQYRKNIPFNKLYEGQAEIRSYLSVPVILRSGKVTGGLVFGHSKPGVFNAGSEDIVKGIASQAAVAIDNSQLFQEISSSNKELIKINNDLDNFVYTASHDLKAPVLNIEGLINAMVQVMKKNDTQKLHKIMQMMAISVTKFKDTIESLTEVSKINKNLDADPELININEILADVKFSIQDMIEETGAVIYENTECTELVFSKPNMKSVLLNLLTNSIKYRSPDRPPVINICCKKDGDKILLMVKDNGLGIPENQLSRIFTMFRRYHSHVEGTGVGLYLVKRIAENYGGSVEVESEVDKGTTFRVSLPLL